MTQTPVYPELQMSLTLPVSRQKHQDIFSSIKRMTETKIVWRSSYCFSLLMKTDFFRNENPFVFCLMMLKVQLYLGTFRSFRSKPVTTIQTLNTEKVRVLHEINALNYRYTDIHKLSSCSGSYRHSSGSRWSRRTLHTWFSWLALK